MKVLCALVVLLAASAAAQRNEVALTAGGYLTRHVHVISDNIFAVQGNVAREILRLPRASLWVDLPIAGSLDARAKALTILGGQFFGTRNYSAIFVSPGVRLKLRPDARVSPYFVAGAGLAHFSKTGVSTSTNTGVFDFGAGLDMKLTRLVILRGEVRDFYSGAPQLIQGLLDREHQLLATGGLVLRF